MNQPDWEKQNKLWGPWLNHMANRGYKISRLYRCPFCAELTHWKTGHVIDTTMGHDWYGEAVEWGIADWPANDRRFTEDPHLYD